MSPDAQIDAVPADFNEAERQLAQARNHHGSAQAPGIDNESAYILLYSAAHKAAAATGRNRPQRFCLVLATSAPIRLPLIASGCDHGAP